MSIAFLKRGSRLVQALLLLTMTIAFMGAGDQEARFQSLGHHMMCVCGCGQILLECNHVGCQYSDRMRTELVAAVERGDNDDLITQAFIQKYGTTVVAAPSTSGFNRVAWIMPFLALVLGLVTTALIVRAWKDRPAPAAPGGVRAVTGPELENFRRQAREETDI